MNLKHHGIVISLPLIALAAIVTGSHIPASPINQTNTAVKGRSMAHTLLAQVAEQKPAESKEKGRIVDIAAPGFGVHDPVMAKEGDTYYMFATGRGISVAASKDMVTWRRQGRVFEAPVPWAGTTIPGSNGFYWAPDISFFNGKWHLYYSISTFGKNRSAIGLATNATLDRQRADYQWQDEGVVVESQLNSDYNAIDPNIVLDENNQPWLSFGSFWSGIKMVQLDAKTGKPLKPDSPVISLASRPRRGAIEAPFTIRHGDFYYLFVSFDACCKGADSTYNIRVGRSAKVDGPYVDRDGKAMSEGGGTLVLAGSGRWRGPGHNAIYQENDANWLVYHAYDAEDRGLSKLHIEELTWDAAGWPQAPSAIPLTEAVQPVTSQPGAPNTAAPPDTGQPVAAQPGAPNIAAPPNVRPGGGAPIERGAINLAPDDKPAFPLAPVGFDVLRDDIPHGTVRTVSYQSTTVGTTRRMLVYTPPGFSRKKKYPVLYLLHGIGGDEREWKNLGTPDIILDNLYAQKKLEPMIVVLPNGRAQPDDRPIGNVYATAPAFEKFEGDLLKDIIPFMAANYPVKSDAGSRAIAGFSMGGGQALNFGLGNLDTFAWVGGFSSGPNARNPEQLLPRPQDGAKKLKLLWISCGNKDGLLGVGQRTHRYMVANKVPHIWHVQPGEHTYEVGKQDVYHFAQLLFREK